MGRYYSYKWAEVLSADCFGAFEDVGLDDEAAVKATGRRFRDTVLAFGGGRAPEKVFHDFRGRGGPSFITCCVRVVCEINTMLFQTLLPRRCFATADWFPPEAIVGSEPRFTGMRALLQ
jgi:hypothetical protein